MSAPAQAAWAALGMEIVVQVTDPAALPEARARVEEELAAADAAYSPVRADTELALVGAVGDEAAAGEHLVEALAAARRAARLSDGLVDPTVTTAISRRGGTLRAVPRPAWRRIACDRERRTVRIPRDVRVDLGSVGKALIADRAARRLRRRGLGVLVAVGGDLATAGAAPAGGWAVRVVDDHREHDGGRIVHLHGGALATSSVTVRRTEAGAHIVDPRTGRPVAGPWRTVSVAAGTCVDANTASTAAIVLGADAPAWLEARRLPARLVAHDGAVACVAGWPTEDSR